MSKAAATRTAQATRRTLAMTALSSLGPHVQNDSLLGDDVDVCVVVDRRRFVAGRRLFGRRT